MSEQKLTHGDIAEMAEQYDEDRKRPLVLCPICKGEVGHTGCSLCGGDGIALKRVAEEYEESKRKTDGE